MHHQAIIGIAGEHIRNNLAECPWKQTFVHIPDGMVYLLLSGGNTSLGIPGSVAH
jgi:hypothetical protein